VPTPAPKRQRARRRALRRRRGRSPPARDRAGYHTSRRPSAERVQTSAASRAIVFFRDSASWSSSSSSGSARVRRLRRCAAVRRERGVRRRHAGSRSPVRRLRAGTQSRAAMAAARIESPRRERSSPLAFCPGPRPPARRRSDQTNQAGERDRVHEEPIDPHGDLTRRCDRQRQRYEDGRADRDGADRARPGDQPVQDGRPRPMAIATVTPKPATAAEAGCWGWPGGNAATNPSAAAVPGEH